MSAIKNLMDGLAIIEQNAESNNDFSFEHDLLYVGDLSKFSIEDTKRLDSLGFYASEDDDCFLYYS